MNDDDECYMDGDWVDCWNCGGEGYSDHDCGEDCCCCLNPEDNVVCDICHGKGGWPYRTPGMASTSDSPTDGSRSIEGAAPGGGQ